MNTENDLIQKLMVSKKIMDRHKEIPRNTNGINSFSTPIVENFEAPNASYNIPQELLSETQIHQPKPNSSIPTKDRILSSKLPDEIKRLMIEHPINQPNSMSGPTLSNDLVEKAARLMNNKGGETINESKTNYSQPTASKNELKQMIRETIEEVLSENGLLIESSNKTNEVFSFRVGEHIFEGKLTKIKKIAK